MSIKNFFFGCLIGGMSGIISFYAMMPFSILGIFIVPGIVFGITTLFYFSFFAKKGGGLIKPLAWIFMCGVSYLMAVLITMQGPQGNECGALGCNPSSFAYFLGGISGAVLVVASFHFIINKISAIYVILTILLAGIASLLDLSKLIPVYTQFIGWQAIVCGLLAASQKDIVFKQQRKS